MTLSEDPMVLPFTEAAPPAWAAARAEAAPGAARGVILDFGRPDDASSVSAKGVSVLVVASDDEVRGGLSSLLGASERAEVLAATDDPVQAVFLTQSLLPEVAIVEINTRYEKLWLGAAHAIREASPETGIVVIASDREAEYVEYKIDRSAGGWSYLLRDNALDARRLLRAVESAAWGLVTVDPSVSGAERDDHALLYGLDDGEHQVLRCMALGYNDRAIQERAGLTPHQLDERLEAIYEALGIEENGTVDRRVRAVMTYHLANRLK